MKWEDNAGRKYIGLGELFRWPDESVDTISMVSCERSSPRDDA